MSLKKIFYIFFLLLGLTLFSEAATRGDVKVIETSENIRYLSQKMSKDYLFLYKNPQNSEVKNGLNKVISKLSNNFRIIATTTKDADTKDILDYLAYSKDEISEILNGEVDEEKAALMLDYSETLLEGADSIASMHAYDFSEEEKMLMITKKIEYLLERITKYYIAFHLGFDDATNREQMQESMVRLEENIEKINLYEYPVEMQKIQVKMNESWKANKVFFDKAESLFIPKLMFTSINYLEDIVVKLALYHSKNQ